MAKSKTVYHSAALFDLTGKVALVTGATGRLGREICFALADMGANLAIVARTKDSITALQADIEKSTSRHVLPLVGDMLHEKTIQQIFGRVEKSFGRLDILVNNITGNTPQKVEDISEDTWNKAMQGTVTGMFLCCKEAGRMMEKQKSGSIINVASIYGMVAADQRIYGESGLNSSVVYGTGKGAVLQLTRYLAAYWGNTGIRVNAVTPGGVEDPSNQHITFRKNYYSRTPMQRLMKREEIRGPIIFLASSASSYMTGHNLVADGGFTII